MELRRHAKLYLKPAKSSSRGRGNNNPMRDRASIKASPMTATATTLVRSIWQSYFSTAVPTEGQLLANLELVSIQFILRMGRSDTKLCKSKLAVLIWVVDEIWGKRGFGRVTYISLSAEKHFGVWSRILRSCLLDPCEWRRKACRIHIYIAELPSKLAATLGPETF